MTVKIETPTDSQSAGRRRRRRRRDIRAQLLARDGCCFYCGCPLIPAWATIDHVQPQSRGGGSHESNLVLACFRCNRRKADYDLQDLACITRRGIGLHRPKHVQIFRSRPLPVTRTDRRHV